MNRYEANKSWMDAAGTGFDFERSISGQVWDRNLKKAMFFEGVRVYDDLNDMPVDVPWVINVRQSHLDVNNDIVAGAKGDGTTDDSTAVTTAMTAISNSGDVYFPKGTYYLADDFTQPAGIRFVQAVGAIIKTASGKTLTLNGTLDDVRTQKFDTATLGGTVVFGGPTLAIYPEWWGIDGTADDVEISAAITAMRAGDMLSFDNTNYYVAAALAAIDDNHCIIEGNNATVEPSEAIGQNIFFALSGDYITCRNLNVKGEIGLTSTYTGKYGIYSTGDYNTIIKCHAYDHGWACIRANGDYNSIIDCVCDGTHATVDGLDGRDALRLRGEHSLALRCLCKNATRWAIEGRSAADYTSWLYVIDCECEDTNLDFEQTDYIYIDGLVSDSSIACNGTRNVVIKNMILTAGNVYSAQAADTGTKENVVMENCKITMPEGIGPVYLNHFRNIRLTNCQLLSTHSTPDTDALIRFPNAHTEGTNITLENCYFDGNSQHAVAIWDTGRNIVCTGCNFVNFTLLPFRNGLTPSIKLRNCIKDGNALLSINRGQGTITAGNTDVDVAHGLQQASAVYSNIHLQVTEKGNTPSGRTLATQPHALTITHFTVTMEGAALGADLDFYWTATNEDG